MIYYEYASSKIWAIKEDNLRSILEISLRLNDPLEAIEARLGRPLDNTQVTTIRDGVAVIPIRGAILKYGGLFEKVSGATSVSTLAKDFTAALENNKVSAIMFDIDSPGGEASGINEFAEMIYNARGRKPIVSYISGSGCSAAYWIASATDKIYIDETAVVGSVGVAAVVRDTEERDAREGIKNIKFVSSGSANKRPDLNTDEGKSILQQNIDAIADVFREKVARNRSTETLNLTSEDVITKFNEGGTLVGHSAVSVGMADGMGSFESVLFSLTEKTEGDMPQMETSMIKDENTSVEASEATVQTDAVDATLLQTLTSEKETLLAKVDGLESVIEGLRSQLEALQAQNIEAAQNLIKTKAISLADGFKDRMTPAQREQFVASYVQLATDDEKNPVDGFKRVDSLVSMWQTTPAHKMTEDVLETTTLDNDTEEEDSTEALFKSLDALALEFSDKQNQAILARKNR